MNQLPTTIPFHPDVGVSDTDMSTVALQNISDFGKPDHQANITVDLDVYIGGIPRLNLARARLVHGQFVGLCSDSPAVNLKNSGVFRSYQRIECFNVIVKDGLTTLLLNFSDLLLSRSVTLCLGATVGPRH